MDAGCCRRGAVWAAAVLLALALPGALLQDAPPALNTAFDFPRLYTSEGVSLHIHVAVESLHSSFNLEYVPGLLWSAEDGEHTKTLVAIRYGLAALPVRRYLRVCVTVCRARRQALPAARTGAVPLGFGLAVKKRNTQCACGHLPLPLRLIVC